MSRPLPPHRYWIGWDPSQMRAWGVAQLSARMTTSVSLEVYRLSLSYLESAGLYRRPTRYPTEKTRGYWDEISQAPMSTGHAIARFLVPHLCSYEGWALFTDGDVLVREDLGKLFALADERYAVQVVQHDYSQTGGLKMEGVAQTIYARKNWSSVILFHCGHPANKALSLELVNTVPGRDLHRFCWLDDTLIGALPPEWNHLIGHSPAAQNPALVHFTEGIPDMPGYEHVPYAAEWYDIARRAGYKLVQPAQERTA